MYFPFVFSIQRICIFQYCTLIVYLGNVPSVGLVGFQYDYWTRVSFVKFCCYQFAFYVLAVCIYSKVIPPASPTLLFFIVSNCEFLVYFCLY